LILPFGLLLNLFIGFQLAPRSLAFSISGFAVIYLIGIVGMGFYISRLFPAMLAMDIVSVEFKRNGRFKKGIIFDSTVYADVMLNWLRNGNLGPVTGYVFMKNGTMIYLSHLEGWTMEDIRVLWRPFMAVVTRYNMRIGPSLEYLLSHDEWMLQTRTWMNSLSNANSNSISS
jgi:hypothetical protein